MKRHVIIAVLVSGLLSVMVIAFANRRAATPQNAIRENRSQSLRQIAKERATATVTARATNLRRYNDINALAGESHSIVLAVVESKASYLLPPEERLVVTDFVIRVMDVLKGDVQRAQAITVRVSGGRVDFSDGTSVEVKMPDFWKNPEVGKSYVFFLESRSNGYSVLRGGPQGLFEVLANGTVKPQVRSDDTLMQNYDGKSLTSFVLEIRASVRGK